MRLTVIIAQSGNSCRITIPPRPMQHLKWRAGTELQLIVRDDHRMELVDSETYYREKYQQPAPAPAAAPSIERA